MKLIFVLLHFHLSFDQFVDPAIVQRDKSYFFKYLTSNSPIPALIPFFSFTLELIQQSKTCKFLIFASFLYLQPFIYY